MSLVEKVKRFFKRPYTIDQLATVISSDVRMAVIKDLRLPYEDASGRCFEQLQKNVSDRLDRQVSEGSLTWHLKKLKESDLIEESLSIDRYTVLRNLTSSGREVFKMLEKVNREPEAEV